MYKWIFVNLSLIIDSFMAGLGTRFNKLQNQHQVSIFDFILGASIFQLGKSTTFNSEANQLNKLIKWMQIIER